MMDSCIRDKDDKREKVDTDVSKREISSEFSTQSDSKENSSLEEREHLKVYLRIRPFTSTENNNGESQDCITIEPPDTVILKPPKSSLSSRLSTDKTLAQTGQRFQFSQVYGAETTQRQLFEGTVRDLVKDVLEGGNSLAFTYGVSNAGKTFTFLGPDTDAGLLPRSLDVIFSSVESRVFTGTSIKPHRCREFTRLNREQQVEEAAFKKNLFRQLKESERTNISLLNSTSQSLYEDSPTLETTVAADDRISLEMETLIKFSIWVSFCEIYNENIHDLLEMMPSGALRRTALRLSQDVKGNTFVKDLRWVQVNSAEEAFKVMKLGKRNQTFSSTKLNQLSSRSHSIFSIRILKIEDVETPRVHTISELCLCDLAGSERCAKTQNKGERLKEAGNINTSLLILGKCINALRHNQQAKLLQHIPFRESKLTHYLQGFFCGRGKACMIVNISQCASMFDETLNVLKFSAVAQKVVILTSRILPVMPKRSSNEVSFIIDKTERNVLQGSRRTSLHSWESSLEDVQEDVDDEYEEEINLNEDTMHHSGNEESGNENEDQVLIGKRTYQGQMALLTQLEAQLKRERAENLVMEARIRDEISREFSELFSEMENDFNDRLAREREILEERAERRLEIFKNLIDNMATARPSQDTQAGQDKSLDSLSSELAGIKGAHKCLILGQATAQGDRTNAIEELERKVNGQQTLKNPGESSKEEEERSSIIQLHEKSSEVPDIQGATELGSQTSFSAAQIPGLRDTERLQEALAATEKEKIAREEVLAALEYQKVRKEEAMASLEEERKAKEEAVCTLRELRKSREEVLALLQEEKRGKEKALAALDAEIGVKHDTMAAIVEEKRSREEVLAAMVEEKNKEAQSPLEQNRETIKLIEHGANRLQECETLQQEVRELTAKLEASESKVTSETRRGEQAVLQLQAVQKRLVELSKSIQGKTTQIQNLTQEVQGLKQELQNLTSSDGIGDLKDEVCELRMKLVEEKAQNENKDRQVLQLQHELAQRKKQQLISDKQLVQLADKLNQQEAASKQQVAVLRKKLQEQEEMAQLPLDELRARLESQEQTSQEDIDQLKVKVEEQKQASKKREQEATSQEQLETLKHKVGERKAASDEVLGDLKQKIREQEQNAELLQVELKKASIKHSHSSSNTAVVGNSEARVAETDRASTQANRITEVEESLKQKDRQIEEKLTELQRNLSEKESQVVSLQKSLQQAQEQRDEEESQAVQEARRREAERRRELLAVAHEAIAQKDAELEKKAEEISRLKENVQQGSEKVKSLSFDLQRKEDDASELREKLADYKKQIQQVQKEISSMREEEKGLKQKLSDVEKSKKQLQSDLANRDRTIHQLKVELSSDGRSEQTLQLYQQARKDVEAKQRVLEDMRLALTEQEETQEQMEQVLEERLNLIEELTSELDKVKGVLFHQGPENDTQQQEDSRTDKLKVAKEEAARAQESLKLCTEKHQTERRKWLEEKLSLIGQAKEAEDKRNQEMRKFAEDRERYNQQQSQLELLSSQLEEKDQTMEKWRKDRDTLVAALEVQLQKLLSSHAEKDQVIQQLQQNSKQPPQECGGGGVSMAELQTTLCDKVAEIQRLKEALKASTDKHSQDRRQTKSNESSVLEGEKPENETSICKTGGRRDTTASVISQSSTGCPSVLDSSEISTENGRTSRFPRPELEISFSPLQPNRMALRRQGEENAVTVKITRSARKRKSTEMEKEEVEAENRRNSRAKVTPKLTPHQEEISTSASRHDSQSSIHSRKEGTLQKIGDFLQSSPTLFGTKAKKMMSLVSSRGDADPTASSSSLRLRAKKKKLYRPEISSPMDMPPHPIITREPDEKESDHQIIKRCLRSRIIK
ncbi:kinesin-like protein KIF20B [Sphaeramia orbicularis]|uniref:kinesin-like protein KIF20B n=1 Tax=Sphaeramia orbicularis TaxID=375764 RepID=UPI00117F8F91|nr:kinesin-like protein KIF20B [Sphaeramia orbicularis]